MINTNDSGAGLLRQAIMDANASAGADVISCNIASGGLTISPASALPGIVEPLTIDGSTQPEFAGAPIIEINGVSAGVAADGLTIATSNSVVRALVINRFPGDGIEITNGAKNKIEGCYVGLNLSGLTYQGNTLKGILITNLPSNTIGGTATADRNYIAGNNAIGVSLGGASSTNNILPGNSIGLNVTNGSVVYSTDGVRVNAPRNIIGGSGSGSRNIISGNTGQGIEITTLGVGTVVRGNYIGTDDTGTLDRGNTTDGIIANAGGVSNYASATALEADATPANNSGFFIVTVASLALPPLSIQWTNSSQLLVSWPSSTPSEFLLETTPNLVPVIVWSPVTNAVANNGTIRYVILNVNAAEPGRFYRLKQ